MTFDKTHLIPLSNNSMVYDNNINKIYLTIIWLHLVIFKTQKTFISPNLQA